MDINRYYAVCRQGLFWACFGLIIDILKNYIQGQRCYSSTVHASHSKAALTCHLQHAISCLTTKLTTCKAGQNRFIKWKGWQKLDAQTLSTKSIEHHGKDSTTPLGEPKNQNQVSRHRDLRAEWWQQAQRKIYQRVHRAREPETSSKRTLIVVVVVTHGGGGGGGGH
jgi:hypothetical protein